MKPGTRVQTTDGPGEIKGKETYSRLKSIRYAILLDGETEVKYYWPHEIKTIKK